MSSTSTAIILRPWDAPHVQVLECDGPAIFPLPEVHRYPNNFVNRPYMAYEVYKAFPDHLKFPRDPSTWEIEHAAARRIYRLIEHAALMNGGWMSQRRLLEIRGRLKLISPHCDEDF